METLIETIVAINLQDPIHKWYGSMGAFLSQTICAFVLIFSNCMQLLLLLCGALSNFIEIGVNTNPIHHFIDLDKAITILTFLLL